MVVGIADGLSSVAGTDFPEQMVDVAFDSGFGDVQVVGDVGVGEAAGDGPEDVGLAGGEVVGQLAWWLERSWGVRGGPERVSEEGGVHGRVEDGLAGRRGPYREGDLVVAGVLGEVADGASGEGVGDGG